MSNTVNHCRICREPITPENGQYSFCSERCRLIDLGNWASETYVAHSPLTEGNEHLDATYRMSRSVETDE